MPGLTWPPPDTDRNRFLCRLQVVLYALVTVYFGLFALATGALLPWSIFTVALAATLVACVALVLMRAQRQAAGPHGPRHASPGSADDLLGTGHQPRRGEQPSPEQQLSPEQWSSPGELGSEGPRSPFGPRGADERHNPYAPPRPPPGDSLQR